MACCLVEQDDGNDYFYIHGGFQNQKYFSDQAFRLHLGQMQWEHIKFTDDSQSPSLAYHTMTPYQNGTKTKFYIFGGIDNEQHTPSNYIYEMYLSSNIKSGEKKFVLH